MQALLACQLSDSSLQALGSTGCKIGCTWNKVVGGGNFSPTPQSLKGYVTNFWSKIVANHNICPYFIKLQQNSMIGAELINFLYFGLFINPLKTRPPDFSTGAGVKLGVGPALPQGVSLMGYSSSFTYSLPRHSLCQGSKGRLLP